MIIRVDKCSTFGIKKAITKSVQYLPKLLINNNLIPTIKIGEASGAALQGGCGGGGVEHPTRQQIGKLLSQSAKLDWLKITTEETKIDFLNN